MTAAERFALFCCSAGVIILSIGDLLQRLGLVH
jgi:hypothetical protein